MGDSKLVRRKKLGLVFFNDEQWIGGTYYTINLVHALNSLLENQKPEIIVFSNIIDFRHLKTVTNYPFLVFEHFSKSEFSKIEILLNKIFNKLFGRIIFQKKYKGDLDALFLMQRSAYLETISVEKRLYWIPDFQYKHYPQFFDSDGLEKNHRRNLWIHSNTKKVILSSETVQKDWNKFYPDYNGKTCVVHFAVTHPEFESLNIDELLQKYSLPKDYFFSPNQFWIHKNHLVAIQAAEKLKLEGNPIVIIFSGKENDNRNPEYAISLKKYVKEKNLGDVVKFLGFLNRREQLKIMSHAKAVIQPSLFEGWSTVIEDAMSMNKIVIASDLDVNIEQLGEQGLYFERNNYISLAHKLSDFFNKKIDYKYSYKQSKFAFEFLKAIDFD